MKFNLFHMKDRNKKVCYFCGTNKNVKYGSKITQEDGSVVNISSCNKCAMIKMNELVEF